jgi:hypothetical protein
MECAALLDVCMVASLAGVEETHEGKAVAMLTKMCRG